MLLLLLSLISSSTSSSECITFDESFKHYIAVKNGNNYNLIIIINYH